MNPFYSPVFPSRARWVFLWVFLGISGFSGFARADVIEDQAGQSTDQALVETYSMEPAPPQFHFRLLKDGRLTAETFPVQSAQVRKIEFRSLWESPLPLKGRLATMITAPGYRYENIWVESVAQEGGELVFQIRQAGVGPGGPAHPVKASGIRSLQFEPSLPPGAMLPPPVTRVIEDATPTPAAPAYYMPPPGVPVEGMIFDRGMGEPVPAPPPAQPQPAPGALIDPGMGLPPPAAPPPAQPQSPGPQGAAPPPDFFGGDPSTEISDALVSVAQDLDKARQDTPGQIYGDLQNQFGVGFLGGDSNLSDSQRDNPKGADWFSVFGFSFGLLPIFAGMAAAFVCGGAALHFLSADQGQPPPPIKKTLITTTLLTTIPPSVFLALVFFLPFKGIAATAGLFAVYFIARAFVMGMFEVLEGKAAVLVISFYFAFGVGIFLAVKFLP